MRSTVQMCFAADNILPMRNIVRGNWQIASLSSLRVITRLIKKITISSIVIGLKKSYFSTNSLAKL